MEKLLQSVKEEIDKIEVKGLTTSSDLNMLDKLLSVYVNLTALKADADVSTDEAREIIKTYSNNTYDRNLNELYDAYIDRRKLYQSDQSIEHRDNMVDSLKRLLTEISDLVTLIWNNATFAEEKDLISEMTSSIERH